MLRVSDKLLLVGSSFLSQGLRIVTTLAMARLVSPDDYGAYALVLSLPALIGAMGDFGIPTTMVQIRDASEKSIIHTAFVLGTGVYLLYGVINLGAGLFLSVTYNDPRLVWVALLASVSSLLAEWYAIQMSVLNRRLDFRGEARQNLAFSVATAVAGVAFAFAGLGIFALVLQLLVGQIIANIAIMRRSPIEWPREFSWPLARRYMTLGGKVSLALYVSTVQGSIANLIVNHIGGKTSLGSWGRATQVTSLFGQNLLQSFERVLFPLICLAEGNVDRRRDLFVRSTLLLMLPSAFACAWLFTGREAIVRLILGPQWTQVPPLLAVAALAIPASVFFSMGYRMAYSMGRTGLMLRAGIIDLLLFGPMLYLVWSWGVIGIAIAWVFSKYLSAALILAGIWRDIDPPTLPLVGRLAGLLLTAVASGFLMSWTNGWLVEHVPALPLLARFILVSILGVLTYTSIVLLTQRSLVIGAMNLSRGATPQPAPPTDPAVPQTL